MPEGGKLIIETANVTLDEKYATQYPEVAPGAYVMLAIGDTGTGMTEEVMAHAFEPFFTTKEVGKGTGLGLSTCYGIVSQFGGHIAIDSVLGECTTMRVYLPRVLGVSGPAPSADDLCRLSPGNETVLLVDDEPLVRGLASTILTEQGYKVLEAANGHEAMHRARNVGEKLDLLLTDVVMPLMGGKELAEQLKIIHPDVKVLFISGYADDTVGRYGLSEGEADFMQKPFEVAALVSKTREVLDRRYARWSKAPLSRNSSAFNTAPTSHPTSWILVRASRRLNRGHRTRAVRTADSARLPTLAYVAPL